MPDLCPECASTLTAYPSCNECDLCGYCDDGQETHA